MKLEQQIRLSQQLVMTPQLQQAIKLLQMSRTELSDMVQEELLENPILEDSLEGRDPRETTTDVHTLERQIELEDRQMADAGQGPKKDDIDWERYLENHAMQAPVPASRRLGDEDLPTVESSLSRAEGLTEHLMWQLQMNEFLDDERRFALLVIGNLDDDGYLSLEGLTSDEVVPKLAEEAGIDPEEAEAVLEALQLFDPIGVCSRTLQECLRVQAKSHGYDDLVIRIIDDHLSNLERRAYATIAKELGTTLEDVYDVAQFLTELEPRPGRNFLSEEPRYITADVYVAKVGDDYVVSSNDEGMPKLKISGYYQSAMKGDAAAKEYIQTKLRSAQWLIRSIDQRRKTIIRVTECIVEMQRDFFDKGIEFLRPMILRDVADRIGMHESTISRVTSNKYVHTPRGIFELKYFFNSAIRRDNQEDIASESVKQSIKQVVSGEDPKAPLSDQQIVEILAREGKGIQIARRTVAKYREMLGILSSSKRKKYF